MKFEEFVFEWLYVKKYYNEFTTNKKISLKEDFPCTIDDFLNFVEKYPQFLIWGRKEENELYIYGLELRNRKNKKFITKEMKMEFKKLLDPSNSLSDKDIKFDGLRISDKSLYAFPT